MKLLCIGDVVSSIGCEYLAKKLPKLRREYDIDMVVCNGENSADGNGITPDSADSLLDCGVDVITTGNHSFRRRESYDYYDRCEQIVRPANYPKGAAPGRGYTVFDMLRYRVAVINIMGTMYLEPLENPFRCLDSILKEVENCSVKIVDFHAEATAEKRAFGYYADGRVSAVVGTHTHVQTSDDCVLPNGTGYITDLGMTGPVHSVLGVRTDIIIAKFKDHMPVRFESADGECSMGCCLFDIDEKTGKARSAKRMTI